MLHHEGTKDTKAAALELSREVIGAGIEVHRLLGPGLLESVYEKALCKELWLRRIGVERQVEVPVYYKGQTLDCSVKLDLLVERTVIVGVKSVDKIINVHRAQVLTYLRLRKLWLGLQHRSLARRRASYPERLIHCPFVSFVFFVPSW